MDIKKGKTRYKRNSHSFRIVREWRERVESAREQRTALYKSDQQSLTDGAFLAPFTYLTLYDNQLQFQYFVCTPVRNKCLKMNVSGSLRFFPRPIFGATGTQTLSLTLHALVCNRMHHHQSVRTILKIPNTGSHTIVWTHGNAAHTTRNG